MKMTSSQQPVSSSLLASKKSKFSTVKQFLLLNADPIQKEATNLHKKYLGTNLERVEALGKYQQNHIKIIQQIAENLEPKNIKTVIPLFGNLGEVFAKNSVQDGLTLEESVDGTIFLKQAIWNGLEKGGHLRSLPFDDYFKLNQTIGTFLDVLTSKLAFTYHHELLYIEENLRYLAEASKILSSSLDYQKTLNSVAQLAVPHIADWCVVDLLSEGPLEKTLNRVALAHKDPKKVKWAIKLRETFPPDMDAPTGVPNVLRTGKSEIYPHITDEMLVALCKTKEQLELARSIGFTSAMIVPIFSDHKPIGAITFVTAETSRYYNQADLLMAEELGNRASVAIENAILYKGSQDAIAVRDDFISVASHELKTPVTSVKIFTQVLMKHSEQIGDQKAVSHLSKMDKQIDKLTELIYDLLNVSKIQAGRIEFKLKKFDFDKTVQEIVEVLQSSSGNHKLIIEGETNKKILGDEERIGQVLNNLISNATKYSPKAKKVIIHLNSDVETITVGVQDFGIGMAKEHLDKIFERFYRVYDTTDKTFPGLGIGLYISSEIIKRHGGKLWVESNLGEGSTFFFQLPVNGLIETSRK